MNQQTKSRPFWHLTIRDILTIVCAAAIPVALAIYTTVTSEQEQRRAEQTWQFELNQTNESRQQTLFDKFLNNIYKLDKDGYLDDGQAPWAFANAYYRAAHRQLDFMRKADAIQFMKEKELIGRNNCTNPNSCASKCLRNIIRLNALNFDGIRLESQTIVPNSLNLDWIVFEQVSMKGAIFSYASLRGVHFQGGTLINSTFKESSLECAIFDGIDLSAVNFGNSSLKNVIFSNVNLTGAMLTPQQKKQATFHNSTLPNGRLSPQTTTLAPLKTNRSAKIIGEIDESTGCKMTDDQLKNSFHPLESSNVDERTKIENRNQRALNSHLKMSSNDENKKISDSTSSTIDMSCTDGSYISSRDLSNTNLQWENADYVEKQHCQNKTGYYAAAISNDFVLYNRNGDSLTMKTTYGNTFLLKSCAMTAAWRNNLILTVAGYRSNSLVANQTFTLQVFSITNIKLTDYSPIDRIVFSATGGTIDPSVNGDGKNFAIDHLCAEFQ